MYCTQRETRRVLKNAFLPSGEELNIICSPEAAAAHYTDTRVYNCGVP